MNQTFNQTVKNMAQEVAEIVIGKQHDYGTKNILNCPVGAELGIIVRISDKLARYTNLLEKGSIAKNESLEDTINDIIGYGLVLKMVKADKFTLPLVDEEEE